VRWGLLAAVTSPVVALLTSALHGVTFSPFLAGGVAFVEKHTPSGLHATAQSLLTTAGFGVGAATGALAGGLLFEAWGAPGMFGAGTLACLAAAGLVYLAARAG
jgi:predicted MFS family arabinose efflux permease